MQPKSAALIYALRCSMMHQGRAAPRGDHPPVAFTFGSFQMPNITLEVEERKGDANPKLVVYAVEMLIEDIAAAVGRWLEQYGETQLVKKNLERFARLRPEGVPPFIGNVPVIA